MLASPNSEGTYRVYYISPICGGKGGNASTWRVLLKHQQKIVRAERIPIITGAALRCHLPCSNPELVLTVPISQREEPRHLRERYVAD